MNPRMATASRTQVSCTHCQLPVPPGLQRPETEPQFCCHGCETAYQLIHGCGLEAYYSMARNSTDGIWTADTEPEDARYLAYDSEKFQQTFATSQGDTGEITLVIEGIHCAACVWLLEKLPQVIPGVTSARVNWSRRTIQIGWWKPDVALSKVAQTLARLGYPPHPIRQGGEQRAQTHENRKQLIRLAVAGAAAGNNMLIAAALYLGMFSDMTPEIEYFLRWASCLVGIVSLVGPGRIFLRGAWFAIKTRTPHMDLPIALGLSVGGLNGVWNTFTGLGEIYFDSLSVLVFVLLLGRYIQYRQQQAAADSIEMLYRLTPKTARRWMNGQWTTVPSDLLEVGDRVQIRAGETFPADGVIQNGQTEVDQAILTGESAPILRKAGDPVSAGTLNSLAAVEMRVDCTGMNTRIGKVLELVESSSRTKPAIVETADRIGAWFVVTVMILAGFTLLYWTFHETESAVDRAVALLIVACPCALALATPLAISVGLNRAAGRHLLIKSGDVFQRLSQPGMMWLDKTGTLTLGQMQMKQWHGSTDLQSAVCALQHHSDHPIARAMVRALSESQTGAREQPPVTNVKQSAQGGIQGQVGRRMIAVGNQNFTHGFLTDPANGISAHPLQRQVDAILARGLTPIYVIVDGAWVALVAVGDSLRPGIATAIDQLHRAGWQVGILSGDHRQVVAQVAAQIGVPSELALGEQLPEDKVQRVQHWSGSGPVVMVGDGVNDSAALAAASVGIAAHHSAETSLQAAPVYLGQPGLKGVLELWKLSCGTMKNIRRNFVVSLAYNAVAVVLAACGWINPLLAALLMPVSSVTVVALSFLPVSTDS